MQYVVAILIGYLLGSLNGAYILGKANGFDIRERGSGNAGASNAKMVLGWKAFIFVLVFDACKGAIAYAIVYRLIGYQRDLGLLAAIMAVFGHMYPIFMEFRGGKGFSSFIGLAFVINWKFALISIVLAMILALLSNWIVAGTISFAIGTSLYCLLFKYVAIYVSIMMLVNAIIIVFKHKINFIRLKNKEEVGINGYYIGTKIKAEKA